MKEEIRKEIGAAQNRRQTGTAYESLAADYLSARGMQILHRNYRSRQNPAWKEFSMRQKQTA